MQSVRNQQHSQCVVNVGMCDHPAAVTAQHTDPNAQVVVELFVMSGVVALGTTSRVHHIIMDCIIRRLHFITASVTIALITYIFTVIKPESNQTLSWVREKRNTASVPPKCRKGTVSGMGTHSVIVIHGLASTVVGKEEVAGDFDWGEGYHVQRAI